MTWHVDDDLVRRYAAGRLDGTGAWSVESHLTACADCRVRVSQAAMVPARRRDGQWRDVVAALDAPAPTPVERLLLALAVPDHMARVLAATRSLTASWLLSVAAVLAIAVVSAHQGDGGTTLFLLLAPLLPLAGVAAAFGPGVDPTYEIGIAAPTSGLRLLLLRTAAVVATSVTLVAVAAALLPTLGWVAAAWLLPALALAIGALALTPLLPLPTAACGLGAAWLVAALLTTRPAAPGGLLILGPWGQLVAAAVAVLAGVLVVRRWADGAHEATGGGTR